MQVPKDTLTKMKVIATLKSSQKGGQDFIKQTSWEIKTLVAIKRAGLKADLLAPLRQFAGGACSCQPYAYINP